MEIKGLKLLDHRTFYRFVDNEFRGLVYYLEGVDDPREVEHDRVLELIKSKSDHLSKYLLYDATEITRLMVKTFIIEFFEAELNEILRYGDTLLDAIEETLYQEMSEYLSLKYLT